MPIYEFYCADCHRIYNFLARRPNVTKRPGCPRCSRPKLERKISRFAISKGVPESSESLDGMDLPAGLDEAKMERVLAEMANEAENVNEDDPRQMARMMRKLYDGTGLPMGHGMEEAMRRMEAGEDPDTIEAEMGDLLDNEDMLFGPGKTGLKGMTRRLRPPEVDEKLYDL
ncbi:MAG: FmdB family zinc ribbon protein [Planctomycetota bacterium]|jgi:putative FmdB family regulatory protein